MTTNTTGMQTRQYTSAMLHYYRRTIAFNSPFVSTAATFDIGLIPAGSVIYDVIVKVGTAFNAGTTNVIKVGTSADDDALVQSSDIDPTSATWQSVRRGCDLTFSSDTAIYATYAQTGTAATAGEAEIIVIYVPDNDR